MASSKAASDASSKKVFDVAKPGKSAPSASAKPIIITNRPILKDPMMAPDANNNGTETVASEKPAPTSGTASRVEIKPISDTAAAEPATATASDDIDKPAGAMDSLPDAEPEAKPAEEPKTEPSPAEPAQETAEKPKAEKTIVPPEAPVSAQADAVAEPAASDASESTAAAPDASAPQEAAKAKDTDKPAEPSEDNAATDKQLSPEAQQAAEEEAAKAEAEHTAAIQKLVDSKQYYLPINSLEKRKTKHFVIAGVVLAVVLGLAWVDVALDAGLIHLGGLKAVTHFFTK